MYQDVEEGEESVRGWVFLGEGEGVEESEVGFCMVFISEGRRLYQIVLLEHVHSRLSSLILSLRSPVQL